MASILQDSLTHDLRSRAFANLLDARFASQTLTSHETVSFSASGAQTIDLDKRVTSILMTDVTQATIYAQGIDYTLQTIDQPLGRQTTRLVQAPRTRLLRGQTVKVIYTYQQGVDVTPILVYWLLRGSGNSATDGPCPDSALPYLQWQFDLTSPFWQTLFANNTSTPRNLVLDGITLHSTRGTKQALVDLLADIGWPNAVILEGQAAWGGPGPGDPPVAGWWPPNQGWAVVRIELGQLAGGSASPIPVWNAAVQYQIGDLVTFPGLGDAFYVAAQPSVGVQPYYDDVGSVPDVASIRDFATLRTYQWDDSAGYRLLSESDRLLIIEAFEFIAPRRCWLDRIGITLPDLVDTGQSESDVFSIGTIAIEPFVDAGQSETDLALFGLGTSPTDAPPSLVFTDNEEWVPTYSGVGYQYNEPFHYAAQLIGDSDILYIDGVLAVEGGSL